MPKIKKKRTKKHNPNTRGRKFFENSVLWSWDSLVENGNNIAHGETYYCHKWISLNQNQVNVLASKVHNWAIAYRAILLFDDGEIAIESELREAKDININDFAYEIESMEKSVFSSVQQKHVIDSGWIAKSFGKQSIIDSGFELMYLDKISEMRRLLWLRNRNK